MYLNFRSRCKVLFGVFHFITIVCNEFPLISRFSCMCVAFCLITLSNMNVKHFVTVRNCAFSNRFSEISRFLLVTFYLNLLDLQKTPNFIDFSIMAITFLLYFFFILVCYFRKYWNLLFISKQLYYFIYTSYFAISFSMKTEKNYYFVCSKLRWIFFTYIDF